MSRASVLFVALLASVSLLAGIAYASRLQPHQPAAAEGAAQLKTAEVARSPWGSNYIPNVPVVTHDGKQYRFYDDLVKGKIVVINFIYTSCKDVCSLTTARLAQVRQMLGDRVGRDIFMYSITLDPEIDGPEVLNKYARNFDTGPGWLFLTGKPDDIYSLRQKLGERSRFLNEHRNDVILGNDATGEWSKDSAFSEFGHLKEAILSMDPDDRARVRPAASGDNIGKAVPLDTTPGQALFLQACAACHTMGHGDRVGPDLDGVVERRSRDWLKRFIPTPYKMIAAKDPVATELAAKFHGLTMPALGLNEDDVDDLLVYLEAHSRHGGQTLSASTGAPSLEKSLANPNN